MSADAEYLRGWHARNPGRSATYSAKWRAANPEKEAARRAKYRRDNSGKRNAYNTEYRKRDYVRLRARLRAYGLSEVQFYAMLDEQGSKCLGCSADFAVEKPYVDHCHKHGHVRGLLCKLCNLALGSARDNPETLRRLAAYLERN